MVGLIDCDNFFCSCERVFRPDLAETPVVVLSNNDGCVVARSREVKAMGVPEGMPYFEMMQKYPDAGIVAFSSNYALYGDLSARVMSILRQEAPDVIQYSIDEAFLDLEGIPLEQLRPWGEALCRKVRKCTGVPVSLGIAPTNTLAKIASKFAKRYPGYNKCCIIADDVQREKALKLTPAGDVWGIGRRIARSLAAAGVVTAYDFTMREPAWVRNKYHVTGLRTWEELRGMPRIEIDAMDARTKQTIVTSRSFPGMITELGDMRSHVSNYAARCAAKLRRQDSVCSTLTVFIQSNHFRPDLPQYDRSAFYTFLTPTNTTPELVTAAMRVLKAIYRPGICYKRAGIMVSGISSARAIQPDLFCFDPALRDRFNRVSAVLDAVNRRDGADTLVMGVQQYSELAPDGRSVKFVNAIRRARKSPDYTTRLGAFCMR